MRPAPFDYLRPTNLSEALAAMAGGALPLAGGQSLLPAMRMREVAPAALVDLAAIAELDAAVRIEGRVMHLGARLTHAALAADPVVARYCPWLAAAALALGDVQVRHRGTVLGNLCWADPRANLVVACAAMDGAVLVAAPDAPAAVATVALADFFTGFRCTALAGRLAVGLRLDLPAGSPRGRYLEFSRQRQDLALVNCCVICEPHTGYFRIAVGGIADVPVRLHQLEERLTAEGAGAATPAAIAMALAASTAAPLANPHASLDFRIHLAGVIVQRALHDCLDLAP
jgi:CO/xanthine dehydrogenase FAD-binding subunit